MEKPSPDLGLPIVRELIERLGERSIKNPLDPDAEPVTVADAFRICGHLSMLGAQSPEALTVVIEDAIQQHSPGGPKRDGAIGKHDGSLFG